MWNLRDGTCLRTIQGTNEFEINQLAFSDDGKHFCSLQYDPYDNDKSWMWKIHDSETCRCVRTLDIQLRPSEIAFSGVGQWLVATAEDARKIRLSQWAATGDVVWRELTGHDNHVRSLAFSVDGTLLASASQRDIRVWDTQTRECVHTFQMPGGYLYKDTGLHNGGGLAVTTHLLAVSLTPSMDGASRTAIYKLSPGEGPFGGFIDQEFICLAFSVDGKLLAASSDSNSVQILDTAALALNTTLGSYSQPIKTATFAPASNLFVSTTAEQVRCWDISGVCRNSLALPGRRVEKVAVSQGAPLVALLLDKDETQVWNLDTGNLVQTLNVSFSNSKPNSLTISHNGKTIALSTRSPPALALWHLKTSHRENIAVTEGRAIIASSISPGGDQIAVATEDQRGETSQVEVLASSTSTLPVTLRDSKVKADILDEGSTVLFSPKGDRVALVGLFLAKIWSLETGQCLWGTEDLPQGLLCHPNFLNLETPEPQQLGTWLSPYSVSGDGWIAKHKNKVAWLPPEYRPAYPLAVCISGSTIAIGTPSGEVKLIGFELKD